MAALPATSTYQLWSVVAGRAISVGVLGAHPATVAFSVDPAVTVTPREARRAIIRNAARRDRAVLRRLAEYDRK